MERTFIALKPDAVQRGLVGELIQKFEKKGFKIIGLKILQVDERIAAKHYEEHIGKPFYEGLVRFITSGPIIAIVLEGVNVIESSRKLMGATNPLDADAGTIRADYSHVMERNIIHGSDSLESAKREIAIYFDDSELVPGWNRDLEGSFIKLY